MHTAEKFVTCGSDMRERVNHTDIFNSHTAQ